MEKKLITKGGFIFDLVITLIFGVFMTWLCSHHAPPLAKESTRLMVGFFAALPVTGTFWLGVSLFRVTVLDMRRTRQEKKVH